MIIIRRTASILCRGRLLVFCENYLSLQSLRGCVEIGRQARLRIWCLRRMGSTPFTRTRKEDAFRCFLQGMCPLFFTLPGGCRRRRGANVGKGRGIRLVCWTADSSVLAAPWRSRPTVVRHRRPAAPQHRRDSPCPANPSPP